MLLLACLSITTLLLPGTNAVGIYTVLAPRIIRPNRDFTVVVSDHGGDDLSSITVQVAGNRIGSFDSREIVELLPDTTQTVKFKIGELEPGNYNLTVIGYGGLNFANTTQLQYESKSYSVFIQTDRGVYKPSDEIKFRAVIVNPLLKPSVTGAIDVRVEDGNGNIIKEWLRVFTNKGVFSGRLQLSEEPVLGNWRIIVDVLKQQTIATVMVAEHVLPKFEVEIDLPSYATFDDKQIVAVVKARYIHGRPVKGEATLQVWPTYKYAYLQAPFDDPISSVQQLRGKTEFSFNIFSELRLKEDYIRELRFTAYVKEDLTERVQNTTSTITIYRYPHKMQLIRTSDSFKPGLKYKAILKMSYQDDTPLREGSVAVRHSFSRNKKNFTEEIHQIQQNGIIPLEFFPPLDQNILSLAIEAQIGNLTQLLADLPRAQSPSNSFLQITLLSDNPQIGEEVQVTLNSTEPMLYFVFEIIGKGDIIFAQTLHSRNNKEYSFRFIASLAMAPRARLVVYYVRSNGEVIADSLHFSVDGALQNDVTLSVNPSVVDAGQDVSITVTTKPNSFVAITSMDQDSLSLGEGNQLTENGVLKELDSYDPGETSSPSAWNGQGNRNIEQSYVSWHGTTTTTEVFENSGVIFMTNGNVPSFNVHISGVIPGGSGPVDGTNLNFRPIINGSAVSPFGSLNYATVRTDVGTGTLLNSPTRPPLAGPYAFSFLPSPPDDKPRIYLNKALPQPWLFHDTRSRLNGLVTLREKVPDSITSYMISAFAVDDFYGLGIASSSHKLTVFRPFFVAVHVPSPVIRGEAIAVEAVVYNYGKQSVTANVTLFNPGDFLFPDFANDIEQGSPASSRSKMVKIESESGTPLSFMIIPQKLGAIDIRVSAASNNAMDAVKKQLIVEPEGKTLTKNKAMFIDLTSESSFSEDINITVPNNIVKDSMEISVSVIGDLIGPAIDNPDNLLQLPTGSGEQNLAKMMPNALLLDYLNKKGQVSKKINDMAVQNMELGFQRQLTFRHGDGSFSAFGDKDNSGSTWLTAFVVRSFPMLRKYISVDPGLIFNATAWLIENQERNGSFVEKGVINNVALQGGANNGVPLTAYVIIALLNIQTNLADGRIEGLRNCINRGLEYISTQFSDMKDSYSLAITTYTFQIANHPLKDSAFYKLEANAQVEGDEKWWSDESLHKTIETVVESKSLDVETTSYALLTYTLRQAIKDSLPLVKWLTSQRNYHGGFQSSQDTFIGLMGITAISAYLQNSNPRLEVQIIYGDRGEIALVKTNNFSVLQKRMIPNETKFVSIKARGSGYAIVQVTYKFNVIVTGPGPSFSLDPQLDRTTDKNKLRLTTCTGYTDGNMSNMAILDVSLPTGFVVDNDLIYSLYEYERVKRVEKKEGGTGVLVYFDFLTPNEICPTITAYRVSKVAFQKKVPVQVYDYYDLSRRARQFYTPSTATLCDICDLEECDESHCQQQIVELSRQLQDPDFLYPVHIDDGSSVNTASAFLLLVINFVIIAHFVF